MNKRIFISFFASTILAYSGSTFAADRCTGLNAITIDTMGLVGAAPATDFCSIDQSNTTLTLSQVGGQSDENYFGYSYLGGALIIVTSTGNTISSQNGQALGNTAFPVFSIASGATVNIDNTGVIQNLATGVGLENFGSIGFFSLTGDSNSTSGAITSNFNSALVNQSTGDIVSLTVGAGGGLFANSFYAGTSLSNYAIKNLGTIGAISIGGADSGPLQSFVDNNGTAVLNSGSIDSIVVRQFGYIRGGEAADVNYNPIGYGHGIHNTATGSISEITIEGGTRPFVTVSGFTFTTVGSSITSGNNDNIFDPTVAGLFNQGSITTLNNGQVGSYANSFGSTTSGQELTIRGNLPANYNIIINNAEYGVLRSVDAVSGPMKFGIYSGGTINVAASAPLLQTYENVLVGFSEENLTGYDPSLGFLAVNYGGFQWQLTPDGTDPTIWDLIFFGSLGPNADETKKALLSNRDAVRSILSLRAAAMVMMMDYDCATFDKQNLCLSFQARYTSMQDMHSGAGVLTAAYRLPDGVRVGAFIDQSVNDRDPVGITSGDEKPSVGGFIAYAQNNKGTNLQAKATAAYNRNDVTITRALFGGDGDTEQGSGLAHVRSIAFAGEVGWGFPLSATTVATPYVGLRRVEASREDYNESLVSGAVDHPIAYSTFSESTTTALVGMKLAGSISERFGYRLDAGVERDFVRKGSDYTVTSDISGLESFSFDHGGGGERTRVFASAGLNYQIESANRLTADVSVRQNDFNGGAAVINMVGYQSAF